MPIDITRKPDTNKMREELLKELEEKLVRETLKAKKIERDDFVSRGEYNSAPSLREWERGLFDDLHKTRDRGKNDPE